MQLLSVLVVYFVSGLEMEIKYMYSLSTAQHNRLSTFYFCFYDLKKCMLKNISTNNYRIDIYLTPVLS